MLEPTGGEVFRRASSVDSPDRGAQLYKNKKSVNSPDSRCDGPQGHLQMKLWFSEGTKAVTHNRVLRNKVSARMTRTVVFINPRKLFPAVFWKDIVIGKTRVAAGAGSGLKGTSELVPFTTRRSFTPGPGSGEAGLPGSPDEGASAYLVK
jgi:hypothetical protein